MKPLPGATLVCKIKSQSELGLEVECCDCRIKIPSQLMMENSNWTGTTWYWETPTRNQL